MLKAKTHTYLQSSSKRKVQKESDICFGQNYSQISDTRDSEISLIKWMSRLLHENIYKEVPTKKLKRESPPEPVR